MPPELMVKVVLGVIVTAMPATFAVFKLFTVVFAVIACVPVASLILAVEAVALDNVVPV